MESLYFWEKEFRHDLLSYTSHTKLIFFNFSTDILINGGSDVGNKYGKLLHFNPGSKRLTVKKMGI
jgi:hypothetical protein